MTALYSEDQTVALVTRLTRTRLVAFVEARIVTPVRSETGPAFRQIDIARLELLCDLSDQFDLEGDALGIVIALIDQLHGIRAELRAIVAAISSEQTEVRDRIGKAVQTARSWPAEPAAEQ